MGTHVRYSVPRRDPLSPCLTSSLVGIDPVLDGRGIARGRCGSNDLIVRSTKVAVLFVDAGLDDEQDVLPGAAAALFHETDRYICDERARSVHHADTAPLSSPFCSCEVVLRRAHRGGSSSQRERLREYVCCGSRR